MNIKLTILAFTLIYVSVLFYATLTFSGPLMLLIAAFPFVLRLVSSISLLALLPVVMHASRLGIPGGAFGANMSLFNLLCISSVVLILILKLVKQRNIILVDTASLCALFFVAWVLLLMLVRGSGMRVLGSQQYGGAPYIHILASFSYFLLVRDLTLPLLHVQRAGLAIAIVPLIAVAFEGIIVVTGGRYLWLSTFILTGPGISPEMIVKQLWHRTRFTFLAGVQFLPWLNVFRRARKSLSHRIGSAFLWGLATVSVMLAGYRSALILYLLWMTAYMYASTKKRMVSLLFILLSSVLMVLALSFLFEYLPYGIQRSLSVVAGPGIANDATSAAGATADWRLFIWRRAIGDIPKYVLFGRGLCYDTRPMASLYYQGFNNPEYAYVTGNFHQALLEILVLYGAPALIAFVFLFIYFLKNKFIPLLFENDTGSDVFRWKVGMATYTTFYFIVWFVLGQSKEILVNLPVYLAFYSLIENSEKGDQAIGGKQVADK